MGHDKRGGAADQDTMRDAASGDVRLNVKRAPRSTTPTTPTLPLCYYATDFYLQHSTAGARTGREAEWLSGGRRPRELVIGTV